MNTNWLQEELARENERRRTAYDLAVRNWRLNVEICWDRGLPIPARPPAPTVERRGGAYWRTLQEWGSAHA